MKKKGGKFVLAKSFPSQLNASDEITDSILTNRADYRHHLVCPRRAQAKCYNRDTQTTGDYPHNVQRSLSKRRSWSAAVPARY